MKYKDSSVKDFYNNNSSKTKELEAKTGIYSNFEYEMISSVSSGTNNPIDAIDIILDMTKTGKIDPWNIDIVKVYDEYMLKLAQLNAQNNLNFVGRAFVFASILLNLKSKVLSGISLADFEPTADFDEDFMDGYDPDFEPQQMQLPSSNVISFDEVLQRRTSVRLNRNRNVTLKDLIRHLEFYEQLEKKKALQNTLERQKRRLGRNYSKLSTADILDMTQDEYIEDLVEKMEQNLNKILEREEKIEITELSVIGFSRPAAYIAILFLSAYGKFDIVQDEFYGDLFIKLPASRQTEAQKALELQNAEIAKKIKAEKAEKEALKNNNEEVANAG